MVTNAMVTNAAVTNVTVTDAIVEVQVLPLTHPTLHLHRTHAYRDLTEPNQLGDRSCKRCT